MVDKHQLTKGQDFHPGNCWFVSLVELEVKVEWQEYVSVTLEMAFCRSPVCL